MDGGTDRDTAGGAGPSGTRASDIRDTSSLATETLDSGTLDTGTLDTGTLDTGTGAFALRLCNLLRERRRADGVRLSAIARRSEGRFSARQLRRVERGDLTATDAAELAALYGADLTAILPARTPIEVDPDGRVETAGAAEEFTPGDPDEVLAAYLRLIRRLRSAERAPVVALRRDDIVVLADALDEAGEHVTDRLGELMDATRTQRRVMVGLFVAGAVVVGLAVTAVAATSGETVISPTPDPVDEPPALDAGPLEEAPVDDPGTGDAEPVPEAPSGAPEGPEPDTVFIDEPWSASVGTPGGIDVSPIPPPDPAPAPAPPAPAPAPADPAPPAPADPEPPPEVAVGPPPVPDDPDPVVDPTPPPDAPTPDAPPPAGEGVGTDDDGNTVAVGQPPVPEPTDPLPAP